MVLPSPVFQNIFIGPKRTPHPLALAPHCSLTTALGNHQSCLSLWTCLFWAFHINGIIRYMTFCNWLHHSACFEVHPHCSISTLFLFMAEFHYMYKPNFVLQYDRILKSSIDGNFHDKDIVIPKGVSFVGCTSVSKGFWHSPWLWPPSLGEAINFIKRC